MFQQQEEFSKIFRFEYGYIGIYYIGMGQLDISSLYACKCFK